MFQMLIVGLMFVVLLGPSGAQALSKDTIDYRHMYLLDAAGRPKMFDSPSNRANAFDPDTGSWPLGGSRHLYVSPFGNDSNSGTSRSAALREISQAADMATPGTVVHVSRGTYGPVISSRGGTASAPVIFASDEKWGAKVSAPGSKAAWHNTADWVYIEDFEIADAIYSGILSTANHGKFLGNHIYRLRAPDCRGGAGVELQNYTEQNNDVIGNVIHEVLAGGDCARSHGIYFQGPNGGRALKNVVYNTSGWGIHLWHNANTITITNNTIFNNMKGGIVVGGSLDAGDEFPGVAHNNTITNNIVVRNGDWGIREMGRVGRNTYSHNLVDGNVVGSYGLMNQNAAANTLWGDPLFINYQPVDGGDYRLRCDSPALNKSITTDALRYDIVYSLIEDEHDIGAYENDC